MLLKMVWGLCIVFLFASAASATLVYSGVDVTSAVLYEQRLIVAGDREHMFKVDKSKVGYVFRCRTGGRGASGFLRDEDFFDKDGDEHESLSIWCERGVFQLIRH